jgi:hypothetical protein
VWVFIAPLPAFSSRSKEPGFQEFPWGWSWNWGFPGKSGVYKRDGFIHFLLDPGIFLGTDQRGD